ncbi:MAG TPA: VOC family protein, partial [Ilumatobacteraceae bacterium]
MAATPFQVTISSADPHALARFWSAALGYAVEDTTTLITDLRAAGVVDDSSFFPAGGQLWWNDLVGIRDPDGHGARILFQRVDHPKQAPNRLHLDLNVGPDRRASEVERLVGLGATILWEIDEPGS